MDRTVYYFKEIVRSYFSPSLTSFENFNHKAGLNMWIILVSWKLANITEFSRIGKNIYSPFYFCKI